MADDKPVEKINKELREKHGVAEPQDKAALAKIRERTGAGKEGNGGKKGKGKK